MQGNQVTGKKDIMNIAIIYFMVIGGIYLLYVITIVVYK